MVNKTYRLVDGFYSWDQVAATVLAYPAHTDILVKFDMVPPMPKFFQKINADPDGQKENYGFALPDKKGIHVKVYDGYYKVHWDKRSSIVDPVGHLYHDAPHWFAVLVVGAVAGLSIGAYYGYKKYKKSKRKN